jgi:DNA polymerase IIIc chi subunit
MWILPLKMALKRGKLKVNNPKVCFFQVKSSQEKLQKICEIAHSYFEKKQPLLILVSDQTSFDFVNSLLWKLPKESFLPHGPPSEGELITINKKLIPTISSVFNLSLSPVLDKDNVKIIYELEDFTTPEKKESSQKRYTAYREAEYSISLSE